MPSPDHGHAIHGPRPAPRRLGIPVDTVCVPPPPGLCLADLCHLAFSSDNPPHSLLSPIVSHFSALPSIPNLKGFLPTSPTAQPSSFNDSPDAPEPGKAVWQEGDLGDGQGIRPLLLVMSSVNALQIFTAPRPSSHADSQASQPIRPPEEAFVIPTIRYGAKTHISSLQSPTASSSAPKHAAPASREKVLSALMLDHQRVLLVTRTSGRKSALALVLMDLGSEVARKRVELGYGTAADIQGSPKVIVVATSHPTPSLHFLDPLSLESTRPAIIDLPTNPQTQLPAFSISGRLLAHAVSSPPAPFSRSAGTLVTSSSISTAKPSQRLSQSSRSPIDGAQGGALLNSAVEIGGGVARGVWAGIKLGARAASDAAARSRNDRLARSAPVNTAADLGDGIEDFEGVESKSLDGESVLESQMEVARSELNPGDGYWVKVIDLYPRDGSRGPDNLSGSISRGQAPEGTIAHFRLPPSSGLPLEPSHPPSPSYPTISQLSFSRCGEQLLVAPTDGRSFHIVELHPASITDAIAGRETKNQTWHLYELKRGHTIAAAENIQWDRSGKWIGIGTGKGTVHVFPIHPCGGPPSTATHLSHTVTNPQQMYPLSTPVAPIARLRPGRPMGDVANGDRSTGAARPSPGQPVFTFLPHGPSPSSKVSYTDNLAIYRPRMGVLEYARLHTRKQSQGTNNIGAEAGHRSSRSQRGSSALTDMMRNRSSGHCDLLVEKDIRGRWSLPGATPEPVVLNLASVRPSASLRRSRASRMGSLAAAEIRTHSPSSRILPHSIYLSRQAEFYSARPIDDYSPLSILDLEARTHKLHFRHEVEARSPSDDSMEKMSVSFKEPLLSALHEIIESPPDRQIPGLPNGYGGAGGAWSAVPIRTVKAGLNEGVGRMRREYARAQYVRERRKADQAERLRAESTGLSFEDDAVFAAYDKDGEKADGAAPELQLSRSLSTSASASNSGSASTPPSSSALPPPKADLSDGESGWGDKWEEEYKRAVEEDGGPDDLVLGLMDEEEDERRVWEAKRKTLD
ncbi:hypothetical protein L202_01324 [Cryptococcus amylolentus CBS 6039]|uniref:BCAS3 WD40 domain-containing protein n=1 Tax=Cryptococcus amylolentus CBS 6039 TaxID=1295533 RepID=A0A1E3I3M1_9TREE|nr:hypothetical protein L202_01324 [Cryptococcus amylolentus CBS 6039]ODN83118.1 hypothetical protein L202_01324 [Cryptococcus amylolentus CBS 6039]